MNADPDLETLNKFVIDSIYSAASLSIPLSNLKFSSRSLPKNILDAIKQRHILKKKVYKDKVICHKNELNRITRWIRQEIERVENEI